MRSTGDTRTGTGTGTGVGLPSRVGARSGTYARPPFPPNLRRDPLIGQRPPMTWRSHGPPRAPRRLSQLRRAQVGNRRVPHKPLLLLWLFGRFAATGTTLVAYREAEEPVSRLINDFGPPVTSPSRARQRAAMPFVHLERELWDLRDEDGRELSPDVPERRSWLVDPGRSDACGPRLSSCWLTRRPSRRRPASCSMGTSPRRWHRSSVMPWTSTWPRWRPLRCRQRAGVGGRGARVRRGGPARLRLCLCGVRLRWRPWPQPGGDRGGPYPLAQPTRAR